jgi:hypothetical protein
MSNVFKEEGEDRQAGQLPPGSPHSLALAEQSRIKKLEKLIKKRL